MTDINHPKRITAAEAKADAEAQRQLKLHELLASIYTQIRQAVSEGKHAVSVEAISASVIRVLKEDGYQINHIRGHQRDPDTWEIFWD